MEDIRTTETVHTTPPVKKKNGVKRFFMKFSIFIILLLGVYIWWKYSYTYSDGYRTGLLQKLSHKGNLAKTYEGELVLSSITSGANVALASEKFYFSVANDSVAKQMMNYEGKRVRLHYVQKNGTLFWRGESEYIVDGVSTEDAVTR